MPKGRSERGGPLCWFAQGPLRVTLREPKTPPRRHCEEALRRSSLCKRCPDGLLRPRRPRNNGLDQTPQIPALGFSWTSGNSAECPAFDPALAGSCHSCSAAIQQKVHLFKHQHGVCSANGVMAGGHERGALGTAERREWEIASRPNAPLAKWMVGGRFGPGWPVKWGVLFRYNTRLKSLLT